MSLLDNIKNFGNNKMPSVLKDPFSKKKITRIYVSFNEPIWSSDTKWKANGSIKFKDGSTNGEQEFNAEGDDAFDQVVLQMRAFIEELQK